MNATWVRFCKLSGRERRDFFLGLLFLPVVVIWLRVSTFQGVQQALEKWHGTAALTNQRDGARIFTESQSASRMLDAASRRGVVRGNCLSRSIALCWLLRRRGIPAQLRIGARKIGNQLEAHAWIEVAGHAINDSDDVQTRYAPFAGPITNKMAAQK
ncbi:MAG TPA: lasso peptide biosynthesis B2 protein [Candidatus Acidoferrales bacterium]|nr:lasso peptide biosynthesis B2 protein [Candidatus Acidoferrales bacterium]